MGNSSSLKTYFSSIEELLALPTSDEQLHESIVNAPFYNKLHATNLDLGIIVLLLVDKKNNVIRRISYSKTTPAIEAINSFSKPFEQIEIPLNDEKNITSIALRDGRPRGTPDWFYLFTPEMNMESARFNQAESGMACSYVYPMKDVKDGAALIFSFYQPLEEIGRLHHTFMKRYATIVAKKLV